MGGQIVLVVEDELPIRGMLVFALQRNGFKTLEASNATEAWGLLDHENISIVLMDWMLPGITGIELLSQIRNSKEDFSNVPVIMLTARAEERNKLKGFNVGANDYVTKPFSPKELIARINVHLKSSGVDRVLGDVESVSLYTCGSMVLNLNAHELTIDGEAVKIRPLEFKLLLYFMQNPNKVHSRSSLLLNIWGHDKDVNERTVDVHIRRLRELLSSSGNDKYLQSIRGYGYKLKQVIV